MTDQAIATATKEVSARGQLVANAADTVTFDKDLEAVDISADGTAEVFVTLDDSDPVTGNKKAYRLPATGSWNGIRIGVDTARNTKITLKSVGTPKYEVSAG